MLASVGGTLSTSPRPNAFAGNLATGGLPLVVYRSRVGTVDRPVSNIARAKSGPHTAPREWSDAEFNADYNRWLSWTNEDAETDKAIQMKTVDGGKENLFRVGMKVEAVDRKFPGLVCVATIYEVLSDQVHVYFDGWNHNYDYWCRCDSPEIQPIGTCAKIGLALQIPGLLCRFSL
jgi:hypothetical protein